MRFSKQTVDIFSGRNVRRATIDLVVHLGARNKFVNSNDSTFGVARIEGYEVPVVRIQNRVWRTLSKGVKYSA